MRTRIFFGAAIIAGIGVMFWLDLMFKGYFVCLAAMVLTGAGLHELFAMARRAGVHPFRVIGISFGVALLPYYLWTQLPPAWLGPSAFVPFVMAPVLALILASMAWATVRREGLEPQFRNIAVTVFGVLYVALPMAFLVCTRFLTEGAGGRHEGWDLMMLVIGVTKLSDVGAYFAGSLLGRHKLAPRVSPKKTVEGAVGGVALSVATALVMVYGMGILTVSERGLLAVIAFGVVVSVASQVGDLTESLLKRSTGTKDSGNLLPSFGGVLDLIDSFLVAAPVAYLVLAVFSHAADVKGAL